MSADKVLNCEGNQINHCVTARTVKKYPIDQENSFNCLKNDT